MNRIREVANLPLRWQNLNSPEYQLIESNTNIIAATFDLNILTAQSGDGTWHFRQNWFGKVSIDSDFGNEDANLTNSFFGGQKINFTLNGSEYKWDYPSPGRNYGAFYNRFGQEMIKFTGDLNAILRTSYQVEIVTPLYVISDLELAILTFTGLYLQVNGGS